MKKKTIFIVTSGEYSNYSIDAVFSQKPDAEAYCKQPGWSQYGPPEIEEWEMDALVKPIRAGYVNYFIRMAQNGDVLDTWTRPAGQQVLGRTYGFDIHKNLIMEIDTKSQEHAVKIANDIRRQIIAEGTWGKNPQ